MSLASLLTQPEFYDIFGLGVFTFILIIGILIAKGRKMPQWVGGALVGIGIAGIIVDGTIVVTKFLLE